jgi:hypothetical protein
VLSAGLAGLACAAFLAAWLVVTPGGVVPGPDAQHYADVARNLLRGNGPKVDIVEYHLGLRDGVRHVPEHHGMLRPFALLPLFAAFGPGSALLRVPGFAYLALTGWVGFLLARRLFGTAAGALAAVLILGDGLLVFCALHGADDMGFAFWCLCAVAALEAGLARGRSLWFALAGLAAGLALLEKQIGVFLPALLLAPLVARRGAPRPLALGRAALALAPFLLCFALYLVRNQLSYGSFAFRLYPLHLILDAAGFEGVYRLFPATVGAGPILDAIGRTNVLAGMLDELGAFARAVVGLPLPGARGPFAGSNLVVALGLASLALVVRVRPLYSLVCLLCAGGALGFVCAAWHVEFRYFAFLVPLCAVALAGAVSLGLRGVGRGGTRAGLRLAALVAGLASLSPAAAGVAGVARDAARALLSPRLPAAAPAPQCADAFAWIRAHTQAGESFLGVDPWALAWHADRPAIMAPAGGVGPIETVVRHYDVRFLVLQPFPGRHRTRGALAAFAARPPAELRAELVFDGEHCDVVALRRAP